MSNPMKNGFRSLAKGFIQGAITKCGYDSIYVEHIILSYVENNDFPSLTFTIKGPIDRGILPLGPPEEQARYFAELEELLKIKFHQIRVIKL